MYNEICKILFLLSSEENACISRAYFLDKLAFAYLRSMQHRLECNEIVREGYSRGDSPFFTDFS